MVMWEKWNLDFVIFVELFWGGETPFLNLFFFFFLTQEATHR